MRSRGLLVLAGLVLAVGAFIAFVERDLPTTDELAERADLLIDIDVDRVEKLVVSHGEETVTLERELTDEGEPSESEILGFGKPSVPWRMTAPLEAKADAGAVDAVLAQIAEVEKVRVLEDGTAADFGLEPPQLSIELVTATGTTSLEIGSELPASSRRVARLGGDPHLFVIEAPFVAAASKAAGDWRDRRLFPGERRDIQSIRLRGAQAEVLLGKRGDRFWLESPVTDVADRDAVEALLSAVTEVSAETFVDGLPASDVDLGLDPGLGAIEVVLQGQEEPFRIVMGTSTTSEPNGDSVEGTESVSKDLAPPPADTSHYARVGGTLVTTSAVLVGPLARSTDDWRSRAWLTVPTYDIEKLVLGGDDPNLVLTRDGVDWKRGEETIEYTVVNQFLTTLSGLRAEAVDTSVTLRDLPTRLSLDVTAKDGTLTTLKIAGNDGDAVWATSSGRSLGLRMPQGTVEQLKTGLEAIRSAEVLTPDPPGDLSSGGGSPDVDADDETAAMKDFS